MDSTRTISELKSAFVWSQVRILSERLELPEDWRNYAVETDEGDLSDKVVEDVLHKVNAAAKQHNRFVYSSQAIHHIAQQIASLYWSSVNQETRSRNAFANGIEKTVDLSSHINAGGKRRGQDTVRLQPIRIRSDSSFICLTMVVCNRFQQLRERLIALDDQRQLQRRRLDQLQHLQHLLEPFQDPQKHIQPNLVTRDGELVQELEKMRMLVARVSGRIAQQKKSGRGVESTDDYSLPGSDRRLAALLDT
ncbi:hypothetical protein N7510_002877 [Penicillium lagena]|uniref:uncharacterized protein n=1 Tax=Penicillium lagena TaxID=94218 RepID=UPI00254260CD|nr:uncharacterized protein N7510_002877 [Penicillium lagena]KAJ5618893.1 hypothetical protein N7510_002877 [Penicillium lagena]